MHDVRCSRCEALLCTQEAGMVTIKGKSEISFKPAGTIKAKCKCGKINTIDVRQVKEDDIYSGSFGLAKQPNGAIIAGL